MRSSRILSRPLLAARLASAFAGRAEATTFRSVANVRAGHVACIDRQPDAASPHVGHLKAGALRVRTMGCRRLAAGGWCNATRRGTRGWVQDRFLVAGNVMRG